jgi:hypothetical protein
MCAGRTHPLRHRLSKKACQEKWRPDVGFWWTWLRSLALSLRSGCSTTRLPTDPKITMRHPAACLSADDFLFSPIKMEGLLVVSRGSGGPRGAQVCSCCLANRSITAVKS